MYMPEVCDTLDYYESIIDHKLLSCTYDNVINQTMTAVQLPDLNK